MPGLDPGIFLRGLRDGRVKPGHDEGAVPHLASAEAERVTKVGLAEAEAIAEQIDASGGRAISSAARSPRRWRSE